MSFGDYVLVVLPYASALLVGVALGFLIAILVGRENR